MVENRALRHVQEGLNNIMNDSDRHPIQYGGLNLCAIAESLLKKLSPLEQLTQDEISTIRSKVEDSDGASSSGNKRRRKTLTRLGQSIIIYIGEKCWCTAFQRQK